MYPSCCEVCHHTACRQVCCMHQKLSGLLYTETAGRSVMHKSYCKISQVYRIMSGVSCIPTGVRSLLCTPSDIRSVMHIGCHNICHTHWLLSHLSCTPLLSCLSCTPTALSRLSCAPAAVSSVCRLLQICYTYQVLLGLSYTPGAAYV